MKKLIFILILVLISGCIQDKYYQEIKNKETAPDSLTFDDIAPKEILGYPRIDESRELGNYEARYGNFEFNSSYRMLGEGDVFLGLKFRRCSSYRDTENAYIDNFIKIDDKYYHKSKPGDFQYIEWYNNGWCFILADYTKSIDSPDDSLVYKAFKELKY